MKSLPKPPTKPPPPESLEFKAFGMGFTATGPRAILTGALLVIVGFAMLAFLPDAVRTVTALARTLL